VNAENENFAAGILAETLTLASRWTSDPGIFVGEWSLALVYLKDFMRDLTVAKSLQEFSGLYIPTYIHPGSALWMVDPFQMRGTIAGRMTSDASTFQPPVKEHTSKSYSPIKMSPQAFFVEARNDTSTDSIYLGPKHEICIGNIYESLQHPTGRNDVRTHQCKNPPNSKASTSCGKLGCFPKSTRRRHSSSPS
jgi:hypothetical protein